MMWGLSQPLYEPAATTTHKDSSGETIFFAGDGSSHIPARAALGGNPIIVIPTALSIVDGTGTSAISFVIRLPGKHGHIGGGFIHDLCTHTAAPIYSDAYLEDFNHWIGRCTCARSN